MLIVFARDVFMASNEDHSLWFCALYASAVYTTRRRNPNVCAAVCSFCALCDARYVKKTRIYCCLL
jgi:hypothetical protein